MQDHKFKELLEKYSNGNCTAEEISWLESAYLKWNVNGGKALSEQQIYIAQQIMWGKITEATSPKITKVKLWPRIAVAAAILVVLSTGLIFYFNTESAAKREAELQAATKSISTGGDKAVLTLAGGKKINLTDAGIGNIAKEAGVSITKSKDGQLVYTIIDQPDARSAEISYNSIATPMGGKYKVVLPDGTNVWLNAASSLRYPSTFSGAGQRRVELRGEAYFEVFHNEAQPFIVKTAVQEIEVLGTHFNVNAYDDEPLAKTTLLEGSVRLNGNTLLKPGQQGVSKDKAVTVQDVDVATFVDWKNGDFSFAGDDFKSVMRKIARWYDVDIFYDQSVPERIKLGGWMSRSKNISSILKLIESTGKVHFKIEGRRITVYK
ncbi:FecR domain-containing protein [Pedobacter sp. MC2016-14]|uniref:FecR family protein n=1 Tax=Pedobacter sp. MC2016-14 TaxID=2897327 RepID=UPI001E3BF764|nr:FecR family protein [Pedobacter sp. MC2016-14]MCD0488383.1 FecR domain-containing protein [Pedobacter sp. MC2016-14]